MSVPELDSFGWPVEIPSRPGLTEILFGPGVFTNYPENDVRRYAGCAAANYVPKLNPRDFLTGFRRTPLLRFALSGPGLQ